MHKVLHSRNSDEWSTPDDLFDTLNTFYHFNLDPCSTHLNAKCDNHFTIEDDGLSHDWSGYRVFCNPPYSKISKWVDYCLSQNCSAVLLLPSRTDTRWFHKILNDSRCRIEFLKGRLRFSNSHNPAPFPSILVFYNLN